MRKLIFITLVSGCTNEPQYVQCAPMGAAAMDVCSLEGGADDGMGMLTEAKGSVHIPVKPEADWTSRGWGRGKPSTCPTQPEVSI